MTRPWPGSSSASSPEHAHHGVVPGWVNPGSFHTPFYTPTILYETCRCVFATSPVAVPILCIASRKQVHLPARPAETLMATMDRVKFRAHVHSPVRTGGPTGVPKTTSSSGRQQKSASSCSIARVCCRGRRRSNSLRSRTRSAHPVGQAARCCVATLGTQPLPRRHPHAAQSGCQPRPPESRWL